MRGFHRLTPVLLTFPADTNQIPHYMQFEAILNAIVNGQCDEGVCAEIRSAISQGEESSLMASLLATAEANANTHQDPLNRVLSFLEKVGASDKPAACCLMAKLMPIASDNQRHEIWDAILLWLTDCFDQFFLNYLKSVATAEDDLLMKNSYNKIIAFHAANLREESVGE